MAVRRLKRNKAGVDPVAFEAVPKAAIRLAGRNAKQPAVILQGIEELDDVIEQRLLDLACSTQFPEGPLVVLGERKMLLARGFRQQDRHRLGKAKTDDPARNLRRRKL